MPSTEKEINPVDEALTIINFMLTEEEPEIEFVYEEIVRIKQLLEEALGREPLAFYAVDTTDIYIALNDNTGKITSKVEFTTREDTREVYYPALNNFRYIEDAVLGAVYSTIKYILPMLSIKNGKDINIIIQPDVFSIVFDSENPDVQRKIGMLVDECDIITKTGNKVKILVSEELSQNQLRKLEALRRENV